MQQPAPGQTTASELRTPEETYRARWEHYPVKEAQASSSGAAASGGATKGGVASVAATIATSLPPGCRLPNHHGLFGAAYAVPKLVLVEDGDGSFVVMNCYDSLYVIDKSEPTRHAVHTISFSSICPSCHAFKGDRLAASEAAAASPGQHDYAVGLSTGEVVSFSMRHHLAGRIRDQHGRGNAGHDGKDASTGSGKKAHKAKIAGVQFYNRDGAHASGRCTSIAWSPRKVSTPAMGDGKGSAGLNLDVLVAGFVDGSLHLYSPSGGSLARVGGQGSHVARSPMKSPGRHVAAESDDTSNTTHNGGSSSFFSSLTRRSSGNLADAKDGGAAAGGGREGQDAQASGGPLMITRWSVCNRAINATAFSR